MKVLKHYAGLKQNGENGPSSSPTSSSEQNISISRHLHDTLRPIIADRETEISGRLRQEMKNVLEKKNCKVAVTGEDDERVSGELSQQLVTGKPDIVLRMAGVDDSDDSNLKKATTIIEVSVDKNGGEKKCGQGCDYAALCSNPNETIIVLSLHFDRTQTDIDLKITQQAFLWVGNDDEKKRRFGFLWREVYQSSTLAKEGIDTDLKAACDGIVRSIDCAMYMNNLEKDDMEWETMGDNVAIEGRETVYKIFDNRFQPTFRKPDNWLGFQNEEYDWMEGFDISTELYFEESDKIETLGMPTPKNKKRRRSGDPAPSSVPYPQGSVRIIKYNYLHGTHYASKVSDFLAIAECISKMHKAGFVHGDVRGFNMLHPIRNTAQPVDPNDTQPAGSNDTQSIKTSMIIDFDLCGRADDEGALYPPGYSISVPENLNNRSGVENQRMKVEDDWKDLASAMGTYLISNSTGQVMESWFALHSHIAKSKNESIPSAIETFIGQHTDLEVMMIPIKKEEIENKVRGTGSPNKQKQRPLGSIEICK